MATDVQRLEFLMAKIQPIVDQRLRSEMLPYVEQLRQRLVRLDAGLKLLRENYYQLLKG